MRTPTGRIVRGLVLITIGVVIVVLAAGCEPRVTVETPKEPIVINLNVRIEHEVRVRVDKELDELFQEEEGLF